MSSSDSTTPLRRGSGIRESFLGTLSKDLEGSSHVSIVDETSDMEADSSSHVAGTTWARQQPPVRRGTGMDNSAAKISRSKSPMRSRTSQAPASSRMGDSSAAGPSLRRVGTPNRSFVSGPRDPNDSDDDGGEEGRDFDDDDEMGIRATTTRSIRTTTAATRSSLWTNKNRPGVVDQRVNLMDAEAGKYERQASARAGRGGLAFRQKSLVDIFLSDDFGGGSHHSRRSLNDSLSSPNKDGGRGVAKWILLFLLLGGLFAAALLTLPVFGIVDGGGANNAPPTTKSPTPAPTEEIKAEQEEVLIVDTKEDNKEEPGTSLADWLLAKEPSPVSVTSPNPNAALDTAAIPTNSRQDALKFLVTDQGISEPGSFQDADSPASKALKWISEDDPARLPVPAVDDVGDAVLAARQLVQRYAMAVFYFSQQVQVDAGNQQRVRRLKEATPEEVANRQQFDQNWISERPVCEWPGVICDSDGLVTAMDVSDSLLGGTLPLEIMTGSAFPAITTLDFSFNQLDGTLPRLFESGAAATGRVMRPSDSALQFLFLQNNLIDGNIDPIVTLKQLTYVDLSNNQLTGTIPVEFGAKLKQLDTFHLAENNLQGTLPSELAGLTELARLDLEGNFFTGTIPAEWSALTGLEMLSLSHCEFVEGTIPSVLASMKSMKHLSLQKTTLQGAIPSFLGTLTQLKELYLHNTELQGTMPTEICSLLGKDGLQALTADCSDLGSVTCDCCTDCFWR